MIVVVRVTVGVIMIVPVVVSMIVRVAMVMSMIVPVTMVMAVIVAMVVVMTVIVAVIVPMMVMRRCRQRQTVVGERLQQLVARYVAIGGLGLRQDEVDHLVFEIGARSSAKAPGFF